MARPVIRNEWAAWAVDTLERTARTFLQGFLGAASIDGISDVFAGVPDTDLGLGAQLAIGAAAGVWAVLTSWAAKPLGSTSSASFLSPTIVVDEHDQVVEYDHGVKDTDALPPPPVGAGIARGPAPGVYSADRGDGDVEVSLDLQAWRYAHALGERLDTLAAALTSLEQQVDPPQPAPPTFGSQLCDLALDENAPPEVRVAALKALADSGYVDAL